mmetsp:Transcript_45914/g.147529  ORF Transcript_45914/g.147529 Transcript_45914/m.147529 type:complete len:239 (-) Transcript_45914:1096-1812(-)
MKGRLHSAHLAMGVEWLVVAKCDSSSSRARNFRPHSTQPWCLRGRSGRLGCCSHLPAWFMTDTSFATSPQCGHVPSKSSMPCVGCRKPSIKFFATNSTGSLPRLPLPRGKPKRSVSDPPPLRKSYALSMYLLISCAAPASIAKLRFRPNSIGSSIMRIPHPRRKSRASRRSDDWIRSPRRIEATSVFQSKVVAMNLKNPRKSSPRTSGSNDARPTPWPPSSLSADVLAALALTKSMSN